MRATTRALAWAAGAAIGLSGAGGCDTIEGIFGGSGGDDEVAVEVAGTASVPGVAVGQTLHVVAVGLDGTLLAEASAEAGGAFALTAEAAEGTRALVTATLPGEPERRAYALVDVKRAATGVVGAQAAKADGPGLTDLRVDRRSSAVALAAAASGDLTQDLGALETRFASQIGGISSALDAGDFPVCSVSATASSGQTAQLQSNLADISAKATPGSAPGFVPELITELVAEARRSRPIEQRLRNMQAMISQVIFSLNNPRLTGSPDYVLGVMPTVLLRLAIWGATQEETAGLSDAPLPRSELNKLAGMIAGMKWGNCREKAYMGAFAASLIPELKQIAVVGMVTASGGSHAVAIACQDTKDVFDLSMLGGSAIGGSDFSLPPAAQGRCFVIDPWQGPAGQLTLGHTEVLDEGSAGRWGWAEVDVIKMVVLSGQPLAPGASREMTLSCGDAPGSCSAFTPPEVVVPPTPDVTEPDAAGDVVTTEDTGPEPCPEYAVVTGPCGGPSPCIEGFYCSTQTIACEQEECPEGASRTYTLDCCCDCWEDKSLMGVYDPCRAGFLLECVPREP